MTDQLPHEAAHLNSARSLTHQMQVPADSHDFDDLVQEGAIAAWLATRDKDLRDPVTYGMVAARHRIVGSLQGRTPMYGSEAEPGRRIYDQFRKVENREVDPDIMPFIVWRRDAFAEVERRIDVERALEGFSDRDLLVAKMLGLGYGWQEIAEAVGTSKNAIHKQWKKNIQPLLREALSTS